MEQLQKLLNQREKKIEDLEYEILVTNMAKLEHLRWNAAHEMLGYTGNPNLKGCDETTKEHNCLVSWEQLIEKWKMSGYDIWSEYRQYDYTVVDTTIKLYETTEKQNKTNDR